MAVERSASQRFAALLRALDNRRSTAFMLIHRGELAFSWGDPARKSSVASVRKSLINVLCGIYVHEGRIDLDATLADMDIDDINALTEEERRATVRHLLMARSGVYHPSVYDIDRRRPARGSHPAGTFFCYNNWDFNVLGTIFERQTGEGLFDAFARRVAVPLGMQDFAVSDCCFEQEPQSIHPVYKMRLTARDLARIGLLYLNHGQWNGEQVVPAAWVHESTLPHSDLGGGRGYGYLWWTAGPLARDDAVSADVPLFYASGLGGQYIIVIPIGRSSSCTARPMSIMVSNTEKWDRC
jgi:CubicO group peptidase (beta-lactamase class C family)